MTDTAKKEGGGGKEGTDWMYNQATDIDKVA